MKNKGMTLIEIMIAMGLLAGVSLGVMKMMDQMNKANIRSNAINQAQQLRQLFYEMVNNPKAWDNTLKDTGNIKLTCLRMNSDCIGEQSPDQPRPFNLHDPSDKIFYEGMKAEAGYTTGGSPCTSFPSDGCPFHVDLTWRAFCEPNTACLQPSIEVSGVVNYKAIAPDRVIAYNPANYSFKIVKQNQYGASYPITNPGGTDTAGAPAGGSGGQRDPASAAPGAAQGNQGANSQQIEQICSALGENVNNPEALAQIKAQLGAMGLSGEATSFIENLPRTCAARGGQ